MQRKRTRGRSWYLGQAGSQGTGARRVLVFGGGRGRKWEAQEVVKTQECRTRGWLGIVGEGDERIKRKQRWDEDEKARRPRMQVEFSDRQLGEEGADLIGAPEQPLKRTESGGQHGRTSHLNNPNSYNTYLFSVTGKAFRTQHRIRSAAVSGPQNLGTASCGENAL